MSKYIECDECGTDKLAEPFHVVGCYRGYSQYLLVKGETTISHANNEYGLYLELGKIRQELGNLAGVHVYQTSSGMRLKAKEVTDLLYDYAWNGKEQ